MRQRYTAEDINIDTARPKYSFPKNVFVGGEKIVLKAYRLLPEGLRDILEEFMKNGFSGDFRRLVVADIFTHTFFFKGKKEQGEQTIENDPADFRGRIRHHGEHHHHGGPPPEVHFHHHDGPER